MCLAGTWHGPVVLLSAPSFQLSMCSSVHNLANYDRVPVDTLEQSINLTLMPLSHNIHVHYQLLHNNSLLTKHVCVFYSLCKRVGR